MRDLFFLLSCGGLVLATGCGDSTTGNGRELVCGNGVVDASMGEACDDGNTTDGDGCQASCGLPTCGDGIVDPDEICDDHNTVDGDGCSATCISDETCGNGMVDASMGEVCDDANTADGDGCSATCISDETCGNGMVDASMGEVCDDANTADGDGCAANCASAETCGNGVIDAAAGEICDDSNSAAGDGCAANCRSDETCSNGVVDTAVGEACDDGNLVDGDGCAGSCMSDETCGNSIVDAAAGEICDDSNSAAGDGCSANCRSDETCSNGVVDTAVGEACDDGNLVDGDGCAGSCMSDETCGNSIVDAVAGEECDDGGTVNGDGCDGMCAIEPCAVVVNTANEDIIDVDWLDDCVDAVGQNVTLTLRDDARTIVYQGSGAKNGDWTSYNNVTSTAVPGAQHDKVDHDRIITLGNGDLLMIAGKDSSNAGCGGSMGNGYGLVIHAPISGAYYDTIRVLVQPYRHTVGGTDPRLFKGWTTSHEISFNNGDLMHSCFPSRGPTPVSFEGSIELTVK